MHFQIVELVKLLTFTVAPFRPSIKLPEFTTREMTNGLLIRGGDEGGHTQSAETLGQKTWHRYGWLQQSGYQPW